MIDELLTAWRAHAHTEFPPEAPALLTRSSSRVVYLDNGWGPPIPYPSAPRAGGTTNHGYKRLKGNLVAVATIPELAGWPEYERFMSLINADASPIESAGCEKEFFPHEAGPQGPDGESRIKVQLGSYTDVFFSRVQLNEDPTNHLRLAAELVRALDGCERWWSGAELGLQRLKYLAGCSRPWGLMIRVTGRGQDETEARSAWAESIRRLGDHVSRLPTDFPIASCAS